VRYLDKSKRDTLPDRERDGFAAHAGLFKVVVRARQMPVIGPTMPHVLDFKTI
jgi:hypothetical protein